MANILTCYLTLFWLFWHSSEILSDVYSFWYTTWHFLSHTFWHSSIWHIYWLSIWHTIGRFIWFAFRHIFWHLICHLFWLTLLFCIVSSMYSDILSDIFSGLHLTFFLAFYLPMYLTIWYSIWRSFWYVFWHLSSIWFGTLSDIYSDWHSLRHLMFTTQSFSWQAWDMWDILKSKTSFFATCAGHRTRFHPCGVALSAPCFGRRGSKWEAVLFWRSFFVVGAVLGDGSLL